MMRYLLALISSLALFGFAPNSQATVTAYLSAGTTCSGGNSASFVPGGPAVAISLCMTATIEQTCGYTIKLISPNAADDSQFYLVGRTVAPIFADVTVADSTLLPRPIVNVPVDGYDWGATLPTLKPADPGADLLLATYYLSPQYTAQKSSYTIGSWSSSMISVGNGSACDGHEIDASIRPSFVMNRAASASLPATRQVITFNDAGPLPTSTPVQLHATASSLLPVSYVSITPEACTIAGSYVTASPGGYGPCIIAADQRGDANFLPAPQVRLTFPIAPYRIPQIASAPPPGGIEGASYLFQYAPDAGTGQFFVIDGTLPTGLSLSSAGTLSGVPAQAGRYIGRVVMIDNMSRAQSSPQQFDITIAPASVTSALTGAWWGGESEAGWGLSLTSKAEHLSAGWYLFDSSGSASWLLMPECAWMVSATESHCSGTLYEPHGAPFDAYDASQYDPRPVGSITFAFSDANHGTMDYVINSAAGTKAISRLDVGGPAKSTTTVNYSDLWWGGAAQSGWGMAIAQSGDTLGAAWYTYDAQHLPMWMILSDGKWTAPNVYSGTVLRMTGSPVVGTLYRKDVLKATAAGSVTLTFDDPDHAHMTWTIDGVTQTHDIFRFTN